MSLEQAFDVVIRQQVLRDEELVALCMQFEASGCRDHELLRPRTRRGHVDSATPLADVLLTSFCYLWAHADALVLTLRHWGLDRLWDDPVLVVDVGCGAGTGAVAVHDLIVDRPAADMDYVGIDHNPSALALANELSAVARLNRRSCSHEFAALEDMRARASVEARRRTTLVLMSYLLMQDLSDADVDAFAELVLSVADAAPEPVQVLINNPNTRRLTDRTPTLLGQLRDGGAAVEQRSATLCNDVRFPRLSAEPPRTLRRSHPNVKTTLMTVSSS